MPSRNSPLRPSASADASLAAYARGALVCALASVAALACPALAQAGGFTGSGVIQPRIDTNSIGRADAFAQTASASGTIDRLSFYLDATSTASEVDVGLYTDASSRPGRRLASCTVIRPRAGAWNSCSVAAVGITSGRAYWGAILQPTRSTGAIRFRDVLSGGTASYASTSGSLGSLPRTYREGQRGSSSPASVYADQAPVAPPPPPPDPDPPPPDPDPTPVPGLSLQPVDGGPAYYGQFSNGLPSADSYFPISVWGSYNHTQANRDLDAAAGLNTYVWVADNSFMSAIRTDGRFRVIQDEGNRTGVGTETAGWLLGDEIDMCCGPPGFAGGNGYQMLQSTLGGLPQDGRFRFANFGKGVMFWETDADAARFVNDYTQVVSNDVYWMTDPNERSTPGYGVPASYGRTVDRMRFLDAMDGKRQPIWNAVEAGWPFTESASAGGRSITGPQIRAAVWHSLIAGARGIIYFQHSFGGPCGGDHHVIRSNCEGTRAAVTAVNAQVKSLAPVLNAPTVVGLVPSTPGVRTMAKWQGGKFWIFAGRTANGGSSSNTIGLPCVGNATATVDGESRTVPVTNGQLTDTFADGNAVHIYRIDGGSSCGLPTG